jgi:D-glycero-D-manno-heptose 1,7-bisphosphate phosphatase
VTSGRAVFLDRDGVINQLVLNAATGLHESPYRPGDVSLAAGAPEALSLLAGIGVPLVVISNQPSAAKGVSTLEDLHSVHAVVEAQLAEAGVTIDLYRYCFHHPEGLDLELGRACACRKPAPGMILDAAAELGDCELSASWVVGDSTIDIEAGRRAGCRTILIEEPLSAHRRDSRTRPDAHAVSLTEAAVMIARVPLAKVR